MFNSFKENYFERKDIIFMNDLIDYIKTHHISSICFVCYGNTCRSPMAEFILKNLIKQNLDKSLMQKDLIKITSAGISASREPISLPAQKQLRLHHIPFNQRKSIQLTQSTINKNDLILVMDNQQYNYIKKTFNCNKVFYLKSILNTTENNNENNINDPFAFISNPQQTHAYNQCFNEIYQCIKQLFIFIQYKVNF